MAPPKVPLPDKLELGPNAVENWKLFKQRWTNYVIIADLDEEENANKKKPTFIHCLNDEALKTYNNFQLPDDATIDTIIREFDKHVIGEINVAYERFCFNRRKQNPGEPFEKFYSDVKKLMKTCDYCENCRDSILRDKLLLGVNDTTLQKDLLKTRKLTLNNCIDMCRANENAIKHNQEMNTESQSVNRIEHKKPFKSQNKKKCKFCGKYHEFKKEKCPAYGKECGKCNKPNHFATVCTNDYSSGATSSQYKPKKKFHKKKVHQIAEEEDDDSSDAEWIYNVSSNKTEKQVKCLMEIGKQTVAFQVDTGASINILPVNFVDNFSPTETRLKVWNNANYVPLGEQRVVVKNPKTNKKYNVNFIICHDDFVPILGLRASEQMSLISVESDNFERVHKVDDCNDVFNNELGTFRGKHSLKIKENAIPIVMPNRKVPVALKQPLKNELDRLTNLNVLKPVDEPTEWVSQSVLTPKKNGSVRLCLDPQELNKVLLREHYTLPTLDDTLHELTQSKVFTKADLASGYWHVKLDDESSKLTTFQTCYGRFRWLRLPFGLSVSAEIFQKKLTSIFSDLEGIVCIADDIIIHGKDDQEHDARMLKFIERCKKEGVKLNKEKLEQKVTSLTFMGHKITKDGLEVDQEKVKAIENFPAPTNVSQLRSFLGLTNFVSKFINNSAEIIHPLHNLLRKNVSWNWSSSQEKAFNKIKEKISKSAKLSYYDPTKELVLENDASEYGLGTAVMQEGKPIAYASRALSDTEKNYAQIEKEMLAIVYGLEKFHHYVYGREVIVTTDHKPLVNITQKSLAKAPKRLQSMLLRIQDYNYKLIFKPGKSIPVADALSRAPVDISEHVNFMSNSANSPIKEEKFEQIRRETEKDELLCDLKKVISEGWPDDKNNLLQHLSQYFQYRDELTIEDGIVFRGERIVIPASLRNDMKKKVHAGHTGINSCLRRARSYIYWPGMSAEIRQFVENCNVCASLQAKQPTQPLQLLETPERPWQRVATDIFTISSRNYLVTVDYFSQYFEVDYLEQMTSEAIINKLKANFARHGIPDTLISDNGPQLVSQEFQQFCSNWNIEHKTSSPGNSQANGAAEAAVKIAKRMMKKCSLNKEDPYIALLNLRNTPQEGTPYSPVQRLMGRRTKTLLPTKSKLLKPDYATDYQDSQNARKAKIGEKHLQKRELQPLKINDKVRMQPIDTGKVIWKPAKVVKQINSRSYIVQDQKGKEYRRDRRTLRTQKTTSSDHYLTEDDDHDTTVTSRQSSPPLTADAPQSPVRRPAAAAVPSTPQPMAATAPRSTPEQRDTSSTSAASTPPRPAPPPTPTRSRCGRKITMPERYKT